MEEFIFTDVQSKLTSQVTPLFWLSLSVVASGDRGKDNLNIFLPLLLFESRIGP